MRCTLPSAPPSGSGRAESPWYDPAAGTGYADNAWVEYYDDVNQASYFYNTITGDTSWNRPDGASNIIRGDELAATPLFEDIDEPPVIGDGDSPWLEYWDESAGARYWYNQLTHEASWVQPPPMDTVEALPASVPLHDEQGDSHEGHTHHSSANDEPVSEREA